MIYNCKLLVFNIMEGVKSTEVQNFHSPIDKEGIPYGNQIVVATNFLYRKYRPIQEGEQRDQADTDGIRGDLALESLNKALSLGVRVVASDGGSSPDFLSTLERFKDQGLTLVSSDVPQRGPQRRRAFETATLLPGGKVIIYTQPEKVSLMDHLFEISKPISEANADIVIPKRNPQLFEQSYPDYMRELELRVNATYDRLMQRANLMTKGENFDWFFGPVVFKNDPAIVALFLKEYEIEGKIRSRIDAQPNPEMHSDGHYFPIIEALFRKMRVVSVEVPFVYPPMQKANEMSPEKIEEFEQKRKEDASAYRLETIHFRAYLKGDPRSKIREVKAS